MNQCFKCKFTFSPQELKQFKSGRSYCQTCILESLYRCEHCSVKFLLSDFSNEYEVGKKLAWKAKSEHVKTVHAQP